MHQPAGPPRRVRMVHFKQREGKALWLSAQRIREDGACRAAYRVRDEARCDLGVGVGWGSSCLPPPFISSSNGFCDLWPSCFRPLASAGSAQWEGVLSSIICLQRGEESDGCPSPCVLGVGSQSAQAMIT